MVVLVAMNMMVYLYWCWQLWLFFCGGDGEDDVVVVVIVVFTMLVELKVWS